MAAIALLVCTTVFFDAACSVNSAGAMLTGVSKSWGRKRIRE